MSDPFVIDCPECDVRHETDRIDDALDFAAGHEEHSGHRPDWARHEFGYGEGAHVVHAVTCDACDDEWTFADADRAAEWAEDHAHYTDHAPDDPDEREERLTADDAESVADVLDALAPATPTTHGVPIGMALAECDRLGWDVADAAAELQAGIERGELFEVQAGEVKVV